MGHGVRGEQKPAIFEWDTMVSRDAFPQTCLCLAENLIWLSHSTLAEGFASDLVGIVNHRHRCFLGGLGLLIHDFPAED